MNTVFWLILTSVVVHGIIAGVSFDVATVKLPTRKRIGVIAYAKFARGNDLGNGIIVYPTIGIAAILLVGGTTLSAYFLHAPQTVMSPLLVACVGTVAHSLCTAGAAPNMLSLRHAPEDESFLASKLNAFAKWHAYRAAFQFLTFVALVWALEAVSHAASGAAL
jgi:hypothetical protein